MEQTVYISPPIFNSDALENKDLFYRTLKDNARKELCISMPAQIIEYDRKTHEAKIQPMLNYIVNGQGAKVMKPFTIEILRMMAGGFIIDFPIKEGDTGWIIAVDRDCYQVKNLRKPALPTNTEVDTYTTGYWIPDQWGNDDELGISAIGEEENGRIVIGSIDGKQKISIGNDGIRIIAPTVSITGNVNVSGTMEVGGLITAKSDISDANGTKLGTHTHNQQSSGITTAPNEGT